MSCQKNTEPPRIPQPSVSQPAPPTPTATMGASYSYLAPHIRLQKDKMTGDCSGLSSPQSFCPTVSFCMFPHRHTLLPAISALHLCCLTVSISPKETSANNRCGLLWSCISTVWWKCHLLLGNIFLVIYVLHCSANVVISTYSNVEKSTIILAMLWCPQKAVSWLLSIHKDHSWPSFFRLWKDQRPDEAARVMSLLDVYISFKEETRLITSWQVFYRTSQISSIKVTLNICHISHTEAFLYYSF